MLLPGRCSHRPAVQHLDACALADKRTHNSGTQKGHQHKHFIGYPYLNGLHYKGVICFFGTLIMQSSLGA